MEKQISQDYGKTVSPEVYINALQGHQYIPQADQCIKNIVQKFCTNKPFPSREYILDVGCGPGRITTDLGFPRCYRIGLDISQDFINYAWTKFLNGKKGADPFVSFQQMNFTEKADIMLTNGRIIKDFDVILMQGVIHHIYGEDRAKFLQKSFKLLRPDGILIIGDEFIKEYESEDERIINVTNFHLHIIGEARKGGFNELAKEEAKNLIDDVLSGEKGAEFASEEVFENIFYSAKKFNESFYDFVPVANYFTEKWISLLKEKCSELATGDVPSFNRGDYKVSLNVFIKELSLYGFVLEQKYEIGPVEQLGGMGVLVFMKR